MPIARVTTCHRREVLCCRLPAPNFPYQVGQVSRQIIQAPARATLPLLNLHPGRLCR